MKQEIVDELVNIAARTAHLATKSGADGAEVLVRDGAELSVKVRLGEPELVKEAGSRALGLRVFVDRRAANTYTSDLSPEALERFVEDSVALARLAEPDELHLLPDVADYAKEFPDLELWDESVVSLDAGWALGMACRGEAAARKADPRVTNSDGAAVSRSMGTVALASSAGFAAGYRGTHVSLLVEPICDDANGKKRSGYHYSSSRFLGGLEDAEAIGLEAARRTIAKLGSRKVETCEVPVIFDREAAKGLLSEFLGVITGSAFYRKSSFLIGREGSQVASPLITIVDDPLVKRGPGSRPFDGDGLASRLNTVVERGVLKTILCDTYSARKLGRASTGSAGRGIGGSPGPSASNFILKPGSHKPSELVGTVERGLYVTEMMGFGFNPVTGDFSRGAGGFWIEKGERVFPVSEVTISANFLDLWGRVDAVGEDLDFRSSLAAPTIRVSGMTVAGR
ncbi:MAG: TldD/PmbA family protein [Deltaproteobacteria bacterium]|nr:TldD/PmbA family protein [Deltaproteobacteria bacterium]